MPWELSVRDWGYPDPATGRIRNARIVTIPQLPPAELLPTEATPLLVQIEKLRAEAQRLTDEVKQLEGHRGKRVAEYEHQLAESVVNGTKAPPTDTMDKYDQTITATNEKAQVLLRAAATPLSQLGDLVLAHQSEMIATNREQATETLTEATTALEDLDSRVAALGERLAMFRWARRLRPDKVDAATGAGSQLKDVTTALTQVRRTLNKVSDELAPAKKREKANA